MEQETQALLRTLIEHSKEATEAAKSAATAATRAADRVGTLERSIEANRLASLDEHKKTRTELETFAEELAALKRRVEGSDPPPPSAPPDPVTGKRPRPPSLVDVATEAHEKAESVAGAQAEHEGRVLVALTELESRINRRLDAQDRAYGIGKRGLAWLVGPRGRSAAIKVATVAALAWGAYERARTADLSAHASPSPTAVHGRLEP